MAFQVGTKVDPRLGALDFSGFTKAADIQAASLLKLGEAIGGAIEEHQEKKIKKQQDEVNIKALKGLSDQYGFNLDDETIKAVYKNDVVRDIFKLGFDQDSTTPQMSPAALRSLGQMFAGEGFEYDDEMQTMVKREGPGFLGGLLNKFAKGQPFTPAPEVFPEELIPKIKGAKEFIENKRIRQRMRELPLEERIQKGISDAAGNPIQTGISDVPGDPSLSSDTVLMVDRQGRAREVLQKDVEAALQNGYKF